MLASPLQRLQLCASPASQKLRHSHQLPRVGEVGIVVEGRNRSLGDGTEGTVRGGRSSHVLEPAALDLRADRRALVAERARLFDGLLENLLGGSPGSPTSRSACPARAGSSRARPARTPGRASHTLEQRGGCGGLAAVERPLARTLEHPGGSQRKFIVAAPEASTPSRCASSR